MVLGKYLNAEASLNRVVLELLATHEAHQRLGLGSALMRWGTEQADQQGLETYLDASEKGQPFYLAHHAFGFGRDIDIPDK